MIIGLTGGIASGKSTVAKMFKELGAKIVDADELGHRVILPGKPAWKKVVNLFGPEILKDDLNIDREKLGKIVFNDPEGLKNLNAITHPEIIKLIAKEIKEAKKRSSPEEKEEILIVDAALIYEAKIDNLMDKVIVVYTEKEEQLRRLGQKSNLSKEEALKRIKSQIPLKEKIKRADYVIDNSNSLDQTRKQVEKVWKKLVSGY